MRYHGYLNYKYELVCATHYLYLFVLVVELSMIRQHKWKFDRNFRKTYPSSMMQLVLCVSNRCAGDSHVRHYSLRF